MAYIVPPTFTSGAILTAAQMTILGNDILAGGPIYTTEAARDAAIPVPFEGQRAYITGSTITAATGVGTAVPTGIQTIHNGSSTPTYAANWVCVTPVGAGSNVQGNTTSTSYVTTLAGDATVISVTLATGTTAMVSYSVAGYNGTATANISPTFSVSGATTLAALDAQSAFFTSTGASAGGMANRSAIYGPLTAGTNTFTLNYKVNAGMGQFIYRNLIVQGIA